MYVVCCILTTKWEGMVEQGTGIKCKLLHLDPLRGFLEMLGGGTAGGRLFPWGVAGAEPDDPACFCLSETTLIILTSLNTSPSTDGPFYLSLRIALLCTLVVPIRILMTFALSVAFQSVPERWEYFKCSRNAFVQIIFSYPHINCSNTRHTKADISTNTQKSKIELKIVIK